MKLARILVPTDFSPLSLRALDDAADLGKATGARILLLHCLEPIYLAAAADLYGPGMNLRMLQEERRRAAEKRLERLARSLEKRGVAFQTLLAGGPAAAVILETAKKRGADLIAMSTHGRSGLSHLFMGSVAEKVVRGAPCPVLTVCAARTRRRAASTRRKRARA
jgi:nucleotide-binding universal stress UspA family protein